MTRRVAAIAAIAAIVLVAGCSGSSSSSSGGGSKHSSAAGTATTAAGGTATTTTPTTTTAAPPPHLVAIRSDGTVVTLDPATHQVLSQLATTSGDDPSISLDRATGDVYYSSVGHSACYGQSGTIYKVPLTGGSPQMVTTGYQPAVSADGTQLAYAVDTCTAAGVWDTKIHIRDIASGQERTLADPVPSAYGLPAAGVAELAWSANGDSLLVSVFPVQDDEGQGVFVVDIASGQSTLVPIVPIVAGQTAAFLLPGTYLPDGNLFVNQQCCAGAGNNLSPTSRLAVLDPATGNLIRQVAVGIATNAHQSLRSDATGQWLLYVSGADLNVSYGGATPTTLTTGIDSADW